VRAPVLINDAPWTTDQKEKFADLCIERLADYAPNAKKIVLKRVVLSPQDLDRINPNLVNGDPGAGKATMDQSLALKPFPKWSKYRTPVKALYMCSPSTHPGGGVSGLAGHNAAMVAIEDSKTNLGH
jgi:phytoene dehydrogenase-like protein